MPDSPPKSNPTSRPKRRWFRYSLRTFLIAVTLICLFVGLKLVPILQQKQAVSALKGNGTFVTYEYDYQVPYYRGDQKGGPPPEPMWPAKLLGVDSCHDVVKVDLIEKGFKPEEFKQALSALRYLPRLRSLQIYAPHTPLQDQDLEPLSRLRQLKDLHLYEDHFGDGVLHYLRNLGQLSKLGLAGNRFSDEGLANLANLTNLDLLDLSENQLTDAGLVHLANLTNLEFLYLDKNRITGEGLRHLAALTKLDSLSLDDNPITDNNVKIIVTLPQLEILSLAHTNVTDACIESLAKMPALKRILAAKSGITLEGVRKLQRLRPELSIDISGDP